MRFEFPLLLVSAVAAALLPSSVNAEVRIAVVGAMSGQFENVGNEIKQGVQVAVEKINDGGGLLGERMSVVHGDDECNRKWPKVVAREMVADKGVVFVAGHLCSGAPTAASEIPMEHGIVQIAPASIAAQFIECVLTSVFEIRGRDDMQGFVFADQTVGRHVKKSAATSPGT